MDTEVLVIGGGATGCGVARDAALRGFATVLVERGVLGSGTTGRFHGVLHSGARYAVTDPVAARECATESAILKRIASGCVRDTGGLALALPEDAPDFAEQFAEACRDARIGITELGKTGGPRLPEGVTDRAVRAFAVPDGVLDGTALVRACARSARHASAMVLEHASVVHLICEQNRVLGASVRRGQRELEIRAPVVVNAAGAWAGKVAALAGCRVPARLSAGVLVALEVAQEESGVEGSALGPVVSRCRAPGDGDIVVPQGGTLVVGTTDTPVDSPDLLPAPDDAVPMLVASAAKLVPGMSSAGVVRAWTAVRPLVDDSGATGRGVSRGHAVIDHGVVDHIGGLITVTGGKATTFRLMAEDAVDLVCRILGSRDRCRTAEEPFDSGTLAP